MGFCTEEEYAEFMRSCPEFERMLVRSGIILIKYYLLSMIPYPDLTPPAIKLPRRQKDLGYVRPPLESQLFVPEVW